MSFIGKQTEREKFGENNDAINSKKFDKRGPTDLMYNRVKQLTKKQIIGVTEECQ